MATRKLSSATKNEYLNIMSLREFLIKNSIPISRPNPKTFLEISKQPHYENVITNILAFFFSSHEVHGFGNLLIESLLDVLKKKSDHLDLLEGVTVSTEFPTDAGGRIDLLIRGDQSAIIIENKVFHWLANDLGDYWNTVTTGLDAIDNQKCFGIVLSVFPVLHTGHSSFVNITHQEFFSHVSKMLDTIPKKSDDKFRILLEDLIQNSKNLSKKLMEAEDLKFFIENSKKIDQLVLLRDRVDVHIKLSVERMRIGIPGIQLENIRKNNFHENRLRRFISRVNSNLMVTIVFEKLASDRSFYMVIELQGSLLREFKDMDKGTFSSIFGSNIPGIKFPNTKEAWFHVYRKDYTLTPEEIVGLEKYVNDKILKDKFKEVFLAIEEFLSKEKSL